MAGLKGQGGSIASNIEDEIENLASANAEVDNIVTAGLRDAAQEMMRHARDNWPVDTGFSYSRWSTDVEDMYAAVTNDAEYSSYVHDGLGEALLAEAFAEVEADVTAFLSDRVVDLINGKP